MKKLIITLACVVAASSSLMAQGSFIFQTTSKYVWDNWSSAAIKPDASNNVAFLIGSGIPTVASLFTSIPTNSGTGYLTSSQLTTAWTDILTDPNYKLATNASTANLASVTTSTLGTISYLSGATFGVTNTSSSGGSISIFVIGWSSAYATPQAAALAGAPVGWSAVFSYAYASSIGTPGNFSAAGMVPFGVTSAAAPVPEPTTLALSALGGASLLLFRRRKV